MRDNRFDVTFTKDFVLWVERREQFQQIVLVWKGIGSEAQRQLGLR